LKEKNLELEQKQKVNNKLTEELSIVYKELEQKNKDIAFLSSETNKQQELIKEVTAKVSKQEIIITKQAQELAGIYTSKKYKLAHKLAEPYVFLKKKMKGN
jgi:predicted  nucleic acid-binding Zn-ribbon protein